NDIVTVIPSEKIQMHTSVAEDVAKGVPDVIMLTVKNLANESVANELQALKLPSSVKIVTMQNGTVAYTYFKERFPTHTVIPAICSFNVQSEKGDSKKI
ncbi:hypothetical protein SARC_15415, partial [Sphaeroforma arctica JP610]